ncbi:MAG: hypothetical protein WC869_00495 [Phycisphaerae bacterium]|jgi:hypothetical protein
MAFLDPLAQSDLQGFSALQQGSDALQRLSDNAALINGFTDTDDPQALIASMVGGSGLTGCLTELVTGLVTAQYVGGYGDSAFGAYLLDLLISPVAEFGSLLSALFIPGGSTVPDDFEFWSAANLQNIGQAFLNPFTSLWMGQFNVLASSFDEFVRGVFWDNSTDQTGNQSLTQQITDRVSLAVHQLFLSGENVVGGIGGMLLFAIFEGIPALEAEITYIKKLKSSMNKLLGQACKLPPSMLPGLPNAIITEHLCRALKELEVVRNTLSQNNKLDIGRFNTATSETCLAKDSIYDPSKGLDGNLAGQFKNLFGLDDKQFNTLRDFSKGKVGALMPDPRFRLQTILVQKYNGLIQATDPQLLKFHENMKEFNATLDGFGALYLGDVFSRIVELLRRQIQMIKTQLDADAAGFSVQSDVQSIAELRPYGSVRQQWDYNNNWGPGVGGTTGLPTQKPYDQTYQQAKANTVNQYGNPNASAQQVDEAFNRSVNQKPVDPSNPNYNSDGSVRVATTQTGALMVSTDVQSQGSDIYSYISTQANAYVILTSMCFIMGQMQKLFKGVQSILSANDRVMLAIKKFVYSYGVNACGDPYGANDINANVLKFMQVAEARLAGSVRTNQPVQDAYKGVVLACDKHEKFLLCMRREINNFLKYLGLSTQLIAALMNLIAVARTVYQLYQALASLDLLGMFKFRWSLSRANILDVLLKALQCLVLQCNNPFMSSLARMAAARFQSQKNNERSKAVTMAMMDEGPSVAQKMGNNNRLQALFKLIQAIQKLTSINIDDLCSISTKAVPSSKTQSAQSAAIQAATAAAAGTTGIDTQYDKLILENQQTQQAAGAAQPFTAFA